MSAYALSYISTHSGARLLLKLTGMSSDVIYPSINGYFGSLVMKIEPDRNRFVVRVFSSLR